jgi:hypothetical protein
MGTREGSAIWNLTWRNKTWIHKHIFWEVRNGKTTRFWEDAWQREPRMDNPDMEELDPGGYQWPPTFSDWLKTVFWQFWQFTIFSSF